MWPGGSTVQVTKELASFAQIMVGVGGSSTKVNAEIQKGLYLHLADGIILLFVDDYSLMCLYKILLQIIWLLQI